jgi:hypothetical protein
MTASPTLPSGEPAAQNHPTYSMDSGMTASDSKCRGGLCAGHLFYPGHHFSYYTIVMPDEAKTRSGIQWIPAFSLDSGQSLRAFRNDVNKKTRFTPALFSA